MNEDFDFKYPKNFIKKTKFVNKNDKENNNNIKYNNNSEKKNKFNIVFNNTLDKNRNDFMCSDTIKETLSENNDIRNIINNMNKSIKYSKNKINNFKKGKKCFDYTKDKEEKKSAKIKGNWICIYCSNLNYFFRKTCNRCNSLKNSC